MDDAKLAFYILLRLNGYSPRRALMYSEEYFSKYTKDPQKVLANMYA